MKRRFPEFAAEFTPEKMRKLLSIREQRQKLEKEYEANGGTFKAADYYDEVEEKFPASGLMRPFMSPAFCNFIAADRTREKIVSATIWNSILVAGDAKLRVWIDGDGKHRMNSDGDTPPASW